MDPIASVIFMAACGLLAAVLSVVSKRFPELKYWYLLLIALIFLCLALASVRNSIGRRDPLGSVLALGSGGFGIALAVNGVRGLYRMPSRPAIRPAPRELQRSAVVFGLWIGAGVPWAVWVAYRYVVELLDLMARGIGPLGDLVGESLAIVAVGGLALPYVRKTRLTESLAPLADAAFARLWLAAACGLFAADLISLMVVRTWDRFWFARPGPLWDGMLLAWWIPRVLGAGGVLLLAGLAMCRAVRGSAGDA